MMVKVEMFLTLELRPNKKAQLDPKYDFMPKCNKI